MTTSNFINAALADVEVLGAKLQNILDECARVGVHVRVHVPRLYNEVSADDVEVKTCTSWDGKSFEYYIEV